MNYHRVLQRAIWSSRAVSRTVLLLLGQTFVPAGPILIGGDDTMERRGRLKIAARGIYRDPVRSRQNHFVKASGRRWLTLMLLVPLPFAPRVGALPFLTILAPSGRYAAEQVRAPKKVTAWMRQAGQLGRTRQKGARLPTLAQVAANDQTRWQRHVVQYWYGELKRTIPITEWQLH